MKKKQESFQLLSDWIDVRSMRQLDTNHQLMGILKQAAKDQRIKIFRSSTKMPIGYVAWANLNRESLAIMKNTLQMPSFPYEWNEGNLMVVFDVVFAPQWEKIARKSLIAFLRSQRFLSFVKRGWVHAYIKHQGQFRSYKLTRNE